MTRLRISHRHTSIRKGRGLGGGSPFRCGGHHRREYFGPGRFEDQNPRDYDSRGNSHIGSEKGPGRPAVRVCTVFSFSGKGIRAEGHQILALNRGEKEKVLAVSLQAPRIGSWASSGMPSSPGRMRRRRAPGTCLRGCLQQADRACD